LSLSTATNGTAAAAGKVSVSDQKVEWLRQRPYLCVSPYTKYDFRIHHTGFDTNCCCNLDINYNKNHGSTDLVDQVRATMDQKKTHPACWRCYQEEDRGHISERIRGLVHYKFDQLEDFDRTGFKPSEVEIGVKFSNLCNLGCRSCDSYDSSTFEKITKRPKSTPDISQDLSEVPEYWNVLLENIKKKNQTTDQLIIHPIGGETFLQPGFHKLLDWLIEQGIAQTSKLRVTTSFATITSDELAEKFKQFHKVELLASIDSVGENYHHVRWPAKFEKVERNLEILTRLYQENPKKFPITGIMPIFSLNNVFYLNEILDFWADWIETTRVPIHMNTIHLYRPVFLAVDILPVYYRKYLIDILEKCQEHRFFDRTTKISSTYEYIISTIKILNNNDTANEDSFSDYLKFSADYDKRTGSDSFVGNKKLFELLTPEHIEIYQEFYKTANTSIPIYYQQ